MIQALIFDCYGVVRIDGSSDQALLDLILALKSHYKIGLLSNVGKGGLQRLFDTEVLIAHFDVVLSSGDIGVAKPETAAFIAMTDALSVLPEVCIMIDDTAAYCRAAERAGMEAIEYWSLAALRRDLKQYGIA